MRLTSPRLTPLPRAAWSDEQRSLLPSDKEPFNVSKTFVRHPALYRPWNAFAQHLLHGSSLPARERELVIVRSGYLCNSPYELHHHHRIALESGLTAEEIARLAQPIAGWSERDSALLQAVDELHHEQMIGDATWARLRTEWSDEQLLDLVFTVGHYMLVAMALNTFGVQIEP